MSNWQIEIPDETRAQIEEHAKREGRDANSWLLEAAIEKLGAHHEEDEADRAYIEGELLKALDSPLIEVTPEWWDDTIAGLNAEADERRARLDEGVKRAA